MGRKGALLERSIAREQMPTGSQDPENTQRSNDSRKLTCILDVQDMPESLDDGGRLSPGSSEALRRVGVLRSEARAPWACPPARRPARAHARTRAVEFSPLKHSCTHTCARASTCGLTYARARAQLSYRALDTFFEPGLAPGIAKMRYE